MSSPSDDHWIIDTEITKLRGRIAGDTETIALLALLVIAHEVRAAFPAAGELELVQGQDWPNVLDPGDLFERSGQLIAPDSNGWEAAVTDAAKSFDARFRRLEDRITRYCNMLDINSESSWSRFVRDVENSRRLVIDAVLGIDLRPTQHLRD